MPQVLQNGVIDLQAAARMPKGTSCALVIRKREVDLV